MINSQLQSGAETPTMLTIPVGSLAGLQAGVTGKLPVVRTLDEQADSAARKCLMYYGPNNNPRLTIGPRNQVTVRLLGCFFTIGIILTTTEIG